MSSVQKSCPHFWHLWLGRAGISTDPKADKWGEGRRVGEPRERERERIVVRACMREEERKTLKNRILGACVSM